MSNTSRLIVCVKLLLPMKMRCIYVTVSSEMILPEEGMMFAHESSKAIEPCEFFLSDLSARSETHL